MRPLIVSIGLLTLAATLAQGQIAAPSLVPGTFGGENPAVIKWGSPSRIGASAVVAIRRQDGVKGKTDLGGVGGGFRLAGETVALGGETSRLETQGAALPEKSGRSNVSLALQSGTALALGLGYDSYTLNDTAQDRVGKISSIGFSLRTGESLFLGAATGRESVVSTVHVTPPMEGYAERDVFKAGLGWRRAGTVLVHAEAFNIAKSDFSGTARGGEQTGGGTLEFTFGPVLLAFSGRQTRVNNFPAAVVDAQTADIGWAPRTGLSVVIHGESRGARKDAFSDPAAPAAVPEVVTRETLGAVVLTAQW